MPNDVVALVDTNVLVYAGDNLSMHYEASRKLRDSADGANLCVAPQVILEYVATVTNPKRVAKASSIGDAWADAELFLSAFRLIAPGPDHLSRVTSLAKSLGIGRALVYDLALAVTMLDAGISTVYTFDDTVFSKVPGITVKTPS
jgi:predicted nucleic acid-binding protein